MRIGIDGTMSSGKTTLFSKLLQTNFAKPIDFIPEASRVIAFEFGIQSTDDWPRLLSNPGQLAAFFRREEEWLSRNESNCCVVDSSFYLVQVYKNHFANCRLLSQPDWPTYDLIFYCEPTEERESDGFRFLNGREEIHQIYKRHRERFRVSEFCDLSPHIDRVEVARDRIARLLTKP